MTDRLKFEQMLEYLINEDQEKAKEIFHDIVVEKSREIYENLLQDDFEEEEMEEGMDDDMEEAFGDDEGDDMMGGDPSDDLMGDTEMGDEEGDEEGDMGGEEDLEDRVMDLEDALDELKAEFEAMMGDEEGMDDMGGDDMGMDDMDPEKEGYAFEANDDDEEDDDDLEESLMREYVEKVAAPKMGDNGANTKSVVAKPNRMGGTSANIAKSFSTEKGGTQGGLLNPSTKEENFGNINVPGGKAGKSAFKKSEPGHGPEKKGKPEQADNKKSIVGSR